MTSMPPAICLSCRRRDATTLSPVGTQVPELCTAFPAGIPDEILRGADHREPRGDEVDGLTFDGPTNPAMFDAWQRFARLKEPAQDSEGAP